MPNYCAVCPNKTDKGCSACKAVLFCSTRCQKLVSLIELGQTESSLVAYLNELDQVWKTHKYFCKKNAFVFEQPEMSVREWEYLVKKSGYNLPEFVDTVKRLWRLSGLPFPEFQATLPEIEDPHFQLMACMYQTEYTAGSSHKVPRRFVQALRAASWPAVFQYEPFKELPNFLPALFSQHAYYLDIFEDTLIKVRIKESSVCPELPEYTAEENGKLLSACRPFLQKLYRQVLIYFNLRFLVLRKPDLLPLVELAGKRSMQELDKFREPRTSFLSRALFDNLWLYKFTLVACGIGISEVL